MGVFHCSNSLKYQQATTSAHTHLSRRSVLHHLTGYYYSVYTLAMTRAASYHNYGTLLGNLVARLHSLQLPSYYLIKILPSSTKDDCSMEEGATDTNKFILVFFACIRHEDLSIPNTRHYPSCGLTHDSCHQCGCYAVYLLSA